MHVFYKGLIDWLIDRLIDRLVDWLIHPLTGQSWRQGQEHVGFYMLMREHIHEWPYKALAHIHFQNKPFTLHAVLTYILHSLHVTGCQHLCRWGHAWSDQRSQGCRWQGHGAQRGPRCSLGKGFHPACSGIYHHIHIYIYTYIYIHIYIYTYNNSVHTRMRAWYSKWHRK